MSIDKRLLMQPATAQITMHFELDDQTMENVFYIENLEHAVLIDPFGPQDMSDDRLGDYCNVIANAWGAHLSPVVSEDTKIIGVSGVWNEAVGVGPLHGATADDGLGVIGTGGPSLPNNVAVCAKLATALLGRSRHGRNYFAGVAAGNVDAALSPNRLTPAAASDWRDALNAFRDAIQATVTEISGGEHRAQLVVASFYDKTRVGALPPLYERDVALTTNALGWVLLDDILDSQRRRLPGRGA